MQRRTPLKKYDSIIKNQTNCICDHLFPPSRSLLLIVAPHPVCRFMLPTQLISILYTDIYFFLKKQHIRAHTQTFLDTKSSPSPSFASSLHCSATFHLSVWKRSASPARQREYGDRWLSCLPMSINHCWHIAANLCYFMLLLVDPGLNHTVLGTKSNLRQFHTLLH